jgi:hypothetical protein
MSRTYMRLIHADQCSTVGDVIPDTNGKGNMHGGGGQHRHDDDGGGSGSSGVKKFFMFVLVTGEGLILPGLAWPGAASFCCGSAACVLAAAGGGDGMHGLSLHCT